MGKTNNSTVPAFGMKDRLGYMFGDFGNDFTFILSSMFMMKFYTDVMGLSAGVVGMLMMAARFVDAFTDVTRDRSWTVQNQPKTGNSVHGSNVCAGLWQLPVS